MILLLFWCENATLSFLPWPSSIAACSAEQQSHACFRFKSTSEWSAGQIVLHKRVFWWVSPSTQRNSSFKTITDNMNKTRWTSTFTYFNHHESWTDVLTSVIAISLTLRWRLASTTRKTVGTTTTTTTTLILTLSSISCLMWFILQLLVTQECRRK